MKTTQKGFAVLESLLIIIIIAVIGGVGWYSIHTKHQTDKILAQSEKTSQSTPATSSGSSTTKTQQYITIKEWGVRAPYNGKLTIEYHFSDNDNEHKYARFSSAQLDKVSSLCAGSKDYGGLFERYSSTDHFLVGAAGIDSGQTASQYATTLSKTEYGHAGNDYFFYVHPQAACGDSSDQLEGQTQEAVKTLLPNLETIPQ